MKNQVQIQRKSNKEETGEKDNSTERKKSERKRYCVEGSSSEI
jgi:hypothetical protein